MELAGLCVICSRPGTMNTCHHCGRQVCLTHYDAKNGICSACMGGLFCGKNK